MGDPPLPVDSAVFRIVEPEGEAAAEVVVGVAIHNAFFPTPSALAFPVMFFSPPPPPPPPSTRWALWSLNGFFPPIDFMIFFFFFFPDAGSDAPETETDVEDDDEEESSALPEVIEDVDGREAGEEESTCRPAVVHEGEGGDPRLVLEVEEEDWDRWCPSPVAPPIAEEVGARGPTEAEADRLWLIVVVVVSVIPSPFPAPTQALFCGASRIFRVFHFFSRLPLFLRACGCDVAAMALWL